MIFSLQSGQDALREAARSFRDYSDSQGPRIAILTVILGILVIILVLYTWLSGRDRFAGRKMFLHLARLNGLEDRETKLFMELARRAQPDNPSALFVRRSAFEAAVADTNADAALVESIRRKLYSP